MIEKEYKQKFMKKQLIETYLILLGYVGVSSRMNSISVYKSRRTKVLINSDYIWISTIERKISYGEDRYEIEEHIRNIGTNIPLAIFAMERLAKLKYIKGE